ncbi:hypothetical protein ABZ484_04130 [Streptomyces sp. NPDC006393]|uniref:hypothetical protein n=1 Tax=Streptomyces sp. NPDC006393 TaxID=3156763 RepID=UPI00340EF952
MSVARTTARLIATCVASGVLVGGAAVPALAAGAGHDRDNGRSYPQSYHSQGIRSDHDHDGRHDRFGDRDRGWHHDHDRDRWDHDRGRHHGWHHGWYRHHDHHFNRR